MRSRRGFLKTVLGPAFAGGSIIDQALFRAVRARAQANYELPELFDIEKVAEGVWAALAKPQTLLNSNAVIFENSTDLLIMDTHSKPSAVAALVRQLRKSVSKKPVRYVVASHFHWDHAHGLPAYRRISSHVDLVSSEATRQLIGEQTLPRLKESFAQLEQSVENYKKQAAGSKDAREKAAIQQMLVETQDYLREMASYKPELPNLTFQRDLILHDKAGDLHLAFRGRGHTSGDVIVYSPLRRTVATGDLLHGFFPFIGDGFPLDWPRTLLQVAEFDFTSIAGGHGGVFRSRERLYQMGNYIEEVTEAVVRGRRAGKPLAVLRSEITPASLKTIADGGYGQSSVEAILRYRMLAPPRPAPAQVLADSIGTNVDQIHRALEKNA
jgi:glyoxylase-like metal-dependent hydrolase (beta-lactamase superfamily II)